MDPSLARGSCATHLATKACCPVPPAPARVVGPAGRSSGLCCRLEKQQKGCTAKMLTQLCLGRLRVLSMFRFTPVRSFPHHFAASRKRLRMSFLSARRNSHRSKLSSREFRNRFGAGAHRILPIVRIRASVQLSCLRRQLHPQRPFVSR